MALGAVAATGLVLAVGLFTLLALARFSRSKLGSRVASDDARRLYDYVASYVYLLVPVLIWYAHNYVSKLPIAPRGTDAAIK